MTVLLQTMVQSSNVDIDLPQGYVWYETMIVLRPDLTEEDRCVQPDASDNSMAAPNAVPYTA